VTGAKFLIRTVKRHGAETLKHILVKNRRSPFERFVIWIFSRTFPEGFRQLESLSKLRISIVCYSDTVDNQYMQLLSGDYWVKHELTKALGEMGYIVTDVYPHVVIHFLGFTTKLPKNAYKLVWIYSHPDRVNPKILKQYDKIFCLSSSYVKKINGMGFEAELMIGATAKKPLQEEIKYDIVFVGNTRSDLPYRKIVQDVGETPYNFKVWGARWKDKLPQQYYGGQYIDNQSLNKLYASSLITLNDHHDDMSREGFVAVRIFDILASGGFCISDKNSGIEEIFGDAVPQYESVQHLRELIDFYINNPDERLKLMEKGREIALSHTWHKRAEQFLKGIESLKRG